MLLLLLLMKMKMKKKMMILMSIVMMQKKRKTWRCYISLYRGYIFQLFLLFFSRCIIAYCVIFFLPSPTFMLCWYLPRSLCMELSTKPFDHRPRNKEHMYSNGVVIELIEFLHFFFREFRYFRYIHISPLNYQTIFNGHFRNLNWGYTPNIWTKIWY